MANGSELKKQHEAKEKKKPRNERVPFQIPLGPKSPNCGYILWKDSKLVMFYTNDLAHTPSEDILHDTSEEAIRCVNGLGPLHRWTVTEMLNRTVFHVPAPIVAYNMFMNSVDIMDQIRSTNPTRRNEKRLSMTMFTLVFDLAVHNAFALYLWIREVENETEQEMSYREFKNYKIVIRTTIKIFDEGVSILAAMASILRQTTIFFQGSRSLE